jgi:hypothetical protein
MRFLRHDGIYRSDVSLLLVNPAQMPPPVGRPRCQAIARDGRSTPCPSSAMSSGRLFLDRGGRHQSPSPLHQHPQNSSLAFRRARIYHRTAGSVLTVCVSRGDKRRRPKPVYADCGGLSRVLALCESSAPLQCLESLHLPLSLEFSKGRSVAAQVPSRGFFSFYLRPAVGGRPQDHTTESNARW